MANVIGVFYLNKDGRILYVSSAIFQNDPSFFKSPFVKYAWPIFDVPPAKDAIGQLQWLIGVFLKEAHTHGAMKDEIIRFLAGTIRSEQYKNTLCGKTPEEIYDAIEKDTTNLFFETLKSLKSLKEEQ